MKTAIKSIIIWMIGAVAPILAIVTFAAHSISWQSAYDNLHGLVEMAAFWAFLGAILFVIINHLIARLFDDAAAAALLAGALAGFIAITTLKTIAYHETPGYLIAFCTGYAAALGCVSMTKFTNPQPETEP